MRCPACHRTLSPVTVDDTTVDVCQDGCAGVWFPPGVLAEVVPEAEEEKYQSLVSVPDLSVMSPIAVGRIAKIGCVPLPPLIT